MVCYIKKKIFVLEIVFKSAKYSHRDVKNRWARTWCYSLSSPELASELLKMARANAALCQEGQLCPYELFIPTWGPPLLWVGL